MALGWAALPFVERYQAVLPAVDVALIVAGGIIYSVGVSVRVVDGVVRVAPRCCLWRSLWLEASPTALGCARVIRCGYVRICVAWSGGGYDGHWGAGWLLRQLCRLRTHHLLLSTFTPHQQAVVYATKRPDPVPHVFGYHGALFS